MPLDNIDLKILDQLQYDSNISLNDLAEQVNLSSTPCWKRVKRLEEQGYIKSRVALLDAAKLNLGVSVFVHIKTLKHDNTWLEHFASTVNSMNEVVECYRMAGEWDYLLRVVVKDIAAYDAFYKRLVNKVGGLSDVTSNFSMEEIKYTTALPII